MEALGVVTSTAKQRKKDQQQPHTSNSKNISYPAYVSIDLGLRQKRGNFSGGTFFQAILLQDTFFEDGDDKANGKGIRIAEGGRYDDLVRHFRPPSNFGSIQVSNYSAVKIPFCSGLIIFVGKMIEVLYTNALIVETWQGHHQLSFIESLRRSVGHPLIDSSCMVIVTGENGLDLATCPERAAIASLLWTAGVSCEYLAQSSVILSLLRHIQSSTSTSPEWVSSADKVSGICAILNIPYVVVVQPHLLKSKASVRLRHIISNTSSGPVYNGSEEVVPLSSLPSLILDRLSSQRGGDSTEDVHLIDHSHHQVTNGESNPQVQPHGTVDMECIYVSTDQYFDNEHRVNNTQWKSIKKIMRTSSHNVSSHISDIISQQNTPVVAIDLSFRVVRDIGTYLTFDGIECLNGSNEIMSKYPQHKKILRNLMYALDALVQKKSQGSSDISDKPGELNLFLYSTVDDKYDLITLEC